MTSAQSSLIAGLRADAREAPESGIVEAMNYGRRRGGVMGLWAGEGDLPTPDFISQEAARALAAGETFYTWQRGLPQLRDALAQYHTRLYGRAFDAGGILRHRLRHAVDPDRDRDDERRRQPKSSSRRRPGRMPPPRPASPAPSRFWCR